MAVSRKKTAGAIVTLWRGFMVLLISLLLPLQASASVSGSMNTQQPCHVVMIYGSDAKNCDTQHEQADEALFRCCTFCVAASFSIMESGLTLVLRVKTYYGKPQRVLAGIRLPPQLHPPLFS